ncbi:MAG: hypothetical protein GXP29_12665 [Planctomycetes bacterium]|nr:hypothetical protein [Planctomycetota bacterium]
MLGRLIAKFGDINAMLSASTSELTQVEGIGERRARAILEASIGRGDRPRD